MNKRKYLFGTGFIALLFIQSLAVGEILFREDFENLQMGPFLDEVLPDNLSVDNNKVWTDVPPEGWEVDKSWMPTGGVRDWNGWTFANVQAWSYVAEDQRRSEFTLASGVAAIADSDEFDDLPNDEGLFESYLNSKPISLTGITGNKVILSFDSSWRPESGQEATLSVSFDGGAPVELFYWNSSEGDMYFHPDTSTNETINAEITVPAGTSSMVLTWGYMNANNNWWWAIDNIKVTSGNAVIFFEDFENLEMGPFLDENMPSTVDMFSRDSVWTNVAPANWVIDNFLVPAGGVRDWSGWTFANAQAWSYVAGDQRRSEFKPSGKVAAIADSDEFDDMASDPGMFETYLSTPSIALNGAAANSVSLRFNSSWRPESNQEATITASFDGKEPVEVMYWTSIDGDANFHPDTSTNEIVDIPINNPAGASNVVLTFGYLNARNNWWWAIDNIILYTGTFTAVSEWSLF
ncbi:MAG: hypothetical protein RBU29_00250 [bacterium]|jgi:hypothetical protein|nr:hypothetical protein [bacterium]